MPRKKCCRMIQQMPGLKLFKPTGTPISELQIVSISLDEIEAIRLADLEGLYHERAAEKMQISRQTFGRIIQHARNKIANALVNGHAIRFEGGEIKFHEKDLTITSD